MAEPTRRSPLTDKQELILRRMANHFATHQRMPTIRELMRDCGYSSPNAALSHLIALADKGYLTLTAGKSRGCKIVGLSEAIADAVTNHVVAILASDRRTAVSPQATSD